MAQPNDSNLTEPECRSTSEPTMTSSTQDATKKDVGLEIAATYGTRSRNRNGNARPNYAEDKDYDVDMYDLDSHSSSKKASRQSNATSHGEGTRGNAGSRKCLGDDAKAGLSQNGGSKEQNFNSATGAPQATQASSNATQPSRKRKAATTTGTPQATPNSTAIVSTRKAGNVTPNSTSSWPETNMLTFANSQARPQNGRLVADDGTVLETNDHVYLVCEPPGEPYYIGRIMEFLHPKSDSTQPVDALRINWYYRPRDIGRKVHDTRVVFATMHSDISPLTALRGKCQIRHRVEIGNPDEYRKTPDSFWFEKLYDRYIQKNYDLIPTASIVNVPERVKKVLDDRWKYVLVEQGRGKELTSAVKSCKRCTGYCASNDSVDCAVCQNTYHMNCVKPPLLKKPSRGFAWSCAACSRAQERKLEARHTPNHADPHGEGDEDEFFEEEEDDVQVGDTGRNSPTEDHHQGTTQQIYQASLWPWRYLGMHCKPEDALDYDDRIYPRASTRIGPRHQATVGAWPGRPVQYVKPSVTKKGGRKDAKAKAEAQAAQLADLYPDGKRPPWVQDTPTGYISRGGDPADPNATATLLYSPPTSEESAREAGKFMDAARCKAKELGLPERSTNLLDIALETFYRMNGDSEAALKALSTTEKAKFKEPILTPAEQKKFEEGVAKYGSELFLVKKHVKTMTPGQVVRYFYTWKKTERGQQVWSNFPGRKGKKETKRAVAAASKLADDVADNDDDSAFDSAKAAEKKRGFRCQFCSITTSRRWRRAPNAITGLVNENGVKATSKDKGSQFVAALCSRCAELWRRYAIRWEDLDEMAKKFAQTGGKGWKRRQDEELLKELQAVQEMGMLTPDPVPTPVNGISSSNGQEPPRKKVKGGLEKDIDSDGGSASGIGSKKKDKVSETPTVPVIPEMPKPRTLPCAICDQVEPREHHLSCRECRLAVHRKCYGIMDMEKHLPKWTCDMCINDKSPQVSIQYKCVLCPVEHTDHDFVDQPKLTHHKKKMSEKDREREKIEVQQARKAAEFYRKKQEEMNRPVNPREPLKRTADNNWVHVTCAVWTPEVKFGNAKAMEPSEGIPSVPRARYDEICKACNQKGGACVSCQHCRLPLHVECARKQGHVLGFEITPVKGSRRDQHNIVSIQGETGTMSAHIWCRAHVPAKAIVHRMHEEIASDGSNEPLNFLQLYVQNFKQADLTLTGTVRKANLMTMAAKTSGTVMQTGIRGASISNVLNSEPVKVGSDAQQPGEKVCISCGIDVSPKWWYIENSQERELTNGHNGMIGSEAQKFVEQRRFQCHKCRKAHRTPLTHPPRQTSSGVESQRAPLPEPALQGSQPALRSPAPVFAENHGRHPHEGWPQGHAVHAAPIPVQAPPHPQSNLTGSRSAPIPQNYPPAPAQPSTPASIPGSAPLQGPRGPFAEWASRPSSQHGSSPVHLDGGPPNLQNGPPMNNMTSLRPPSLSGPPPGPVPVGHQHVHGHAHGVQPYLNGGMEPSPRRSGPAPPSPYAAPYQPATMHGPSSSHVPPHGLSNGVPAPRPEAHGQGLPSQRPPFSGPQGSPLSSRPGPPQGQELPPPIGTFAPPRSGPDGRPPSGASASPSLRNLLS